nr:hypothetical protein [Tanacetum cinerariifolium]
TSLQRQHSELLAKFQAQEVEINRLKERVKILEDKEGVIGDRSRDDVTIKGRRIDEEEVATERVSSDTEEVRLDEGDVVAERASEDTEEMAIVLTTIDATTVLASAVVDVPTGSGSIPTASTPAKGSVPTSSEKVPTASPVFANATVVTPYRRRKGKKVVVESETPKKQKVQEQIDAQVARELKEQLSQQRKSWTKKQKRDYYMAVIRNNLGWKVKDFKSMTFKEVEAKFNSVCKQIEDFIPMGSKEEAERIKRKRAYWKITRLGGSSASYQFFTDLLKHLDRDDLNQLWLLVKETLNQLWTHTQNFMHALAEWKLYDKCGVHQLTSKNKYIFMLVEKDYPLRKGLALVMISYKLQVENYSQMADDLVRKIYNIANSPRQQGD